MTSILTAALAAIAPYQVAAFGIAATTCTAALAPTQYPSAYAWVMGYFSGVNSGTEATVGSTTDGDVIITEVQMLCRRQPSLRLIEAVEEVYIRMRDEGR